MERTIKLRASQMANVLMSTLQIFLGFAAVTLVVLLVIFTLTDTMEITFSLFQDNWMYGIAEFISEFIGIFLFILIVSDGLLHFDSGLRLGISRTQYFMVSILIYLLINLLDLLTDGISQALNQNLDLSKGIANVLTLENFIGSFAFIILIAIVFYGVYRFGFKFLMILGALFLLVSIAGGFGAFAVWDSGNINIGLYLVRIFEWIEKNLFLMKSVGAVLATITYFFLIQRMPIQD